MWKVAFCFLFTISSNLVRAFYTPIYFREEEVRHVRSVVEPKPICEENKFIELLAERQITSPESIIGIAIADFEGTCTSTTLTLRKLDDYLKNCTAPKSLYTYLLNGLRTFDEKLCKNIEFYKRYDKFDKCYTDLDKDYDSCDGAPDWNESEQQRACKIYKKILDCYYIKTAKVCGLRAALTLKELMTEVIDCTLPVRCSVGSSPTVKDPMPEKYVDTLEGEYSSGKEMHFASVFIYVLILLPIFK